MVRRVSSGNRRPARSAKGQGLVEFAFVSFLLFALLLGIIEMGRFMFTYSVVSNAAQEGSRYGIVRPRDVYNVSAAATARAQGTSVPTQIVVANGNCNVIDKAREKALGIPANEMQVSVWYDNGNGTPIRPNATPTTQRIIDKGNRIVVETSYKFFFIVPLVSQFAPNGVDVKMRSARTMLGDGEGTIARCAVNLTPVPQPTSTAAPTASPTEINPTIPPPPPPDPTSPPQPTSPPVGTGTVAPTGTPRPVLRLDVINVIAIKKVGNNKPLGIQAAITNNQGPYSSANVRADVYRNGTIPPGPGEIPWVSNVPLASVGAGLYRSCPVGNYTRGDQIVVNIYATAPNHTPAQLLGTEATEAQITFCR